MKRYFALSRTSHIFLDMATPAFCALLWLGRFPDLHITIISLITAFSGYTAVYALNDIAGYAIDREKMRKARHKSRYSVEASELRHPIAQGEVSYRAAVLWAAAWFVLAAIGAYFLNPVILLIFMAAACCEVAYCMLLTVSPWRIVLSGIVKAAGPVSAVYVVDSAPSPLLLLLLFLWVFFWELGGQNIPADWNDKDEDRLVGAKTVPVLFGDRVAGEIILFSSIAAVFISGLFVFISPLPLGMIYVTVSILIGWGLFIRPAYALYSADRASYNPAHLFDMASYYPLGLFLFMCGLLIWHNL